MKLQVIKIETWQNSKLLWSEYDPSLCCVPEIYGTAYFSILLYSQRKKGLCFQFIAGGEGEGSYV